MNIEIFRELNPKGVSNHEEVVSKVDYLPDNRSGDLLAMELHGYV